MNTTIQKFKQQRKNIPKLQTAWQPITKDGVTYNVYPSAIGASQLNVTTPEVIVKDVRGTGTEVNPESWTQL